MRIELVAGWRSAWRWWSVRLHVLATLAVSLLLMVPAMPAEVQAILPEKWRPLLIAAWLAAGLFARLVKQGPKQES